MEQRRAPGKLITGVVITFPIVLIGGALAVDGARTAMAGTSSGLVMTAIGAGIVLIGIRQVLRALALGRAVESQASAEPPSSLGLDEDADGASAASSSAHGSSPSDTHGV